MFEGFEKPQDNTENNSEATYESRCDEFQKTRDEKLEEFYKNLGDAAKRHEAELHSAVENLFGGILEKMGK